MRGARREMMRGARREMMRGLVWLVLVLVGSDGGF
jgi:hypothetical protein